MPNAKLASLGSEVRKHRGNKSLREAAREIGISPATLMRVESGRVPDVETFGKLCAWLGVDPGDYLGIKTTATESEAPETSNTQPTHFLMSAHFKADRTPKQETVQALASMIMFAASSARQKTTLTDADT